MVKRRSKVYKRMSREQTLNFDQSRTFSENCKAIIVKLQFVYKINNDFRSQFSGEFIQTQTMYPTLL